MKRFLYGDKHLAFLRLEFPRKSVQDLTIAFNHKFKTTRTKTQTKSALSNNKITCGRKQGELTRGRYKTFTVEQVEFLRENYPVMSRTELTKAVNDKFNLDRTFEQVTHFMRNHGIKSGRNGQFSKGRESWNKGTKGLMGANSGSFKKGDKAHNWRPVDSERVNIYGYIEIKISATPSLWEQKHRVVWQRIHGPIAPGFIVRFIDGDRCNCDPDNLMLISDGVHAGLNLLNYNQSPDKFKPTMMLLAQLWAETKKKANNRKDK